MKKFLAGDPATERLAACDVEAEFYRPFFYKKVIQHLNIYCCVLCLLKLAKTDRVEYQFKQSCLLSSVPGSKLIMYFVFKKLGV